MSASARPSRRLSAVAAISTLVLGLLSVTAYLAASADARAAEQRADVRASAHTVDRHTDALLTQMLAKLGSKRGFTKILPTPVPRPVPTPGPISTSPTPAPVPVDPTPTPTPTPTPVDPTPTPTPVDPTPTPTPTPTDPNGTLVWSDNFDGSAGSAPNSGVWDNITGGKGWGNNELECYTDSRRNSALDGNGDLVITARYQPGYRCADGSINDYTSAKLVTYGLQWMKYGKLRVRAQLPAASGLWPAIWALGDDNYSAGWPQSGEIDVAEVVGQSPSTLYGTLHGPTSSGTPYGMGGEHTFSSPVSDGMHEYGVDWSPDAISFTVDGMTYKTFTRAQVGAQGAWVFDHPYFLLLNVAVGGNWPGTPKSNAVFPQTMTVDYVRVYK